MRWVGAAVKTKWVRALDKNVGHGMRQAGALAVAIAALSLYTHQELVRKNRRQLFLLREFQLHKNMDGTWGRGAIRL